MLSGVNKYPICLWNDPVSAVGRLKLEDLSVATFFYKSAELAIKN